MRKQKNITSREDAVTKDMLPSSEREQRFNIPSLGVTVQAKSLGEAFAKAKDIVRARGGEVTSNDQ